MKKKKGNAIPVVLFIGSMVLLLVSFLTRLSMEYRVASIQDNRIENALKVSALSGLLYDLNIYGTSHKIIITDSERSYNEFLTSLKTNLKLNDSLNPNSIENYIKSQVNIEKYIIYNVDGNNVEVITKGDIGESQIVYTNQLGNIKTPEGITVENTSIYVQIKFTVEIMGENIEAVEYKTVGLEQK